MSRHQQFKNEIKKLNLDEDSDYNENGEEEFSEKLKLLKLQTTEDEVRKFLKQNDDDEYQAIDQIVKLKNKQKQDEKNIDKKVDDKNSFQPLLVKRNSQTESIKTQSFQIKEEIVNQKRKISKEILEILDPVQEKTLPLERNIEKYNQQYTAQQVVQKGNINNHINLAIVGHVDSGKSTLIGQILYQNSQIDEKTIRKYDKESGYLGKNSFKYLMKYQRFAWVSDQREDERERGVTIDVGLHQFTTANRKITILDTPGHKDFVPNMIYGAAQADVAILMIDANSFEQGFDSGQTKEHAILVKSLGVVQIIVAVNKMDQVQYSEQRYLSIQEILTQYLQKVGFHLTDIQFIPISGLLSENIVTLSKNTKWYEKQPLLEIIDQLKIPDRDYTSPLRMSINNFYQSNSGKLRGFCLQGKIESGQLTKGTNYLIQPHNLQVQIKEIFNYDQRVDSASVGDSIDCQIQISGNKTVQTGQFISIGNVLCDKSQPIPITNHFQAEIMCFDIKFSLLKGSQVVLHLNSQRVQGYIFKILKLIDKKTGTVIKKNPKSIKSNEFALVELKTDSMICLELFSNIKSFGRITMREKQDTISIGVINQIY